MDRNEEVWLPEPDRWGIDRLAWEEQDDGVVGQEEPQPAPEDPRY
jgi:hypothetical protein